MRGKRDKRESRERNIKETNRTERKEIKIMWRKMWLSKGKFYNILKNISKFVLINITNFGLLIYLY